MPKKAIDYSKCMFYRLVCRDITVTEVYVGHTTSEVKRRNSHKTKCHNENAKAHNYFVYRFIREHGGFENWQLLVHEKLAMKDDVEARLRERFWCEHYQAKLNKQVPGRTIAEYNADHREEIKAYCTEWHADHREEQNKRSATWNLANYDRMREKHDCACGGKYTIPNHSQHLRTKKHLAFEAN